MVRNKRELLAAAADMANHAKTDLRNQLIRFMEDARATQRGIAEATGLSDAEINQILNGDCELTISALAKLLVATDNGFVIAPTEFLRHLPAPPQMPAPRTTRGTTRGTSAPTAQPSGTRQRDEHGRFVSGRSQSVPTPTAPTQRGCKEIDLDELSRKELVELVKAEGFEREIDTRNASRGEIIDFLEEKQQSATRPTPTRATNAAAAAPTAQPTAAPQEGSDERLVQLLLDELSNNPHLRGVVDRFMHGTR